MDEQNAVVGQTSSLGVSITSDDLSKVGFTANDMQMVNDLGGKTDAFGAPILPDNLLTPESAMAQQAVDPDIQKFVSEALGQTPTAPAESVAKEGDAKAVVAEPLKADAIGKTPYTADEMANLDPDTIDTSRIPDGMLPFYKAMLRPVTRKSQEYSDRLKSLERQTMEANAKLDAQRRWEYQQRLQQEEATLTPEELADKRKQEEFQYLRNEVQAMKNSQEQSRLTQAIEDDYSANAKLLGIPDEVKDDALTMIWKQWQLDNANQRPRASMREILEASKPKLDRLAGNVVPNKLDLNTLKGLLRANPDIGKAYVTEIINQYVQSKKQGATVMNANPTVGVAPQPEGEQKIKSWDDWQRSIEQATSKYVR